MESALVSGLIGFPLWSGDRIQVFGPRLFDSKRRRERVSNLPFHREKRAHRILYCNRPAEN